MEGNTWLGILDDKLPAESLLRWVGDPAHGAQVSFFGVIRNHNLGRPVLAVSYDVYEDLALNLFGELVRAARDRWGASLRVAILHRRGRLEIGDLAVAIVVSCPHRDEAYQASRFLIEEVKHRAPIWKQEHYLEGSSEWVQGHSLCQHSEPSR